MVVWYPEFDHTSRFRGEDTLQLKKMHKVVPGAGIDASHASEDGIFQDDSGLDLLREWALLEVFGVHALEDRIA